MIMDQHFSFRLVFYLLDILWILQSTRQEVVCFFYQRCIILLDRFIQHEELFPTVQWLMLPPFSHQISGGRKSLSVAV